MVWAAWSGRVSYSTDQSFQEVDMHITIAFDEVQTGVMCGAVTMVAHVVYKI